MLRVFFALLLLANVGMFAWQRGHLDSVVASGREPARMSNQLNADKIRLLPPAAVGQDAPAPVAPPPAPAQPEENAATPAPASDIGTPAPVVARPAAAAQLAAVAAPTLPAQPAQPVAACTEIGDFNAEDAGRFATQLAALELGSRAVRKPLQEATSYVVHIPPQPDKEAVERKAAELRGLGVDDFFIILDNSPLRWGISLGVFRHESAAKVHLTTLAGKGVRSARIAPRLSPNGLVAYQLRRLAPQERTALDRVAAGFPQKQLRDCRD